MKPLTSGAPLAVTAIVLFFSCAVQAQTTPMFQEDVGYLSARRDKVLWQSPELLVAELRSTDDVTRLKALYLLGLTPKQAHHSLWAQTSPTRVIGEKVATPDQIQLTYAALGSDATQQAVIAVEDSEGQMTYAAVVVATRNGWERVAVFDCWCKYEMYSGLDTLMEFVQLRPAPQHGAVTPQRYELVFRASGGGTGIYTQNEAHYRVLRGTLRRVLSFVSNSRSCPPAEECTIEKRWFYPTAIDGAAGGILVSSRDAFSPNRSASDVRMSVRELQDRHLHPPKCRTYKWDEQTFKYTPSGTKQTCEQHGSGASNE
jgi:hypothetical protein